MAARPRVAAAGAPMLAVRDLAISFGGVRALDGVSLEVDAGEIRGIIGPNGAGKTTLLNVICGFERPARGEVIVAGSPVTGLAASGVAARGLTRTFQTTQLFRGMTVLENVMTGRHLHLRAGVLSAALDRRAVRAEEAEAAAAARRALAFVGMESFADARGHRAQLRPAAARRGGARPRDRAEGAAPRRARRRLERDARRPSSTRSCGASATSTASPSS